MRLSRVVFHGAVVALASALGAQSAAAWPETTRQRLGRSTAAMVSQINSARHAHGLRALRVSADLGRAARAHAGSMAEDGYFAHGSPAARIRRYYRGSKVGEAMLWRSPTVGAKEAVQAWLASPAHRRILLSKSFREVGVGLVSTRSGGAYDGRTVTIVVADFGAR